MERLSENVQQSLQQFINNWTNDETTIEQITINRQEVAFESNNDTVRVPLDSIIANKSTILLRKCEQDLDKEGIGIIPFPDYIGINEEERLRVLIEETTTPEFKQRKSFKRLETLYYLGDVLRSRGYRTDDKTLIRQTYDARNTRNLQKSSKRVFELFSARGLANLYTTDFIGPTHLVDLSEEDFYDRLLPYAQQLKLNETASMVESSQELTLLLEGDNVTPQVG